MNEEDLYESMQNLNPSVDKLGKDRDFKENVMQCIRYLDKEVKERVLEQHKKDKL